MNLHNTHKNCGGKISKYAGHTNLEHDFIRCNKCGDVLSLGDMFYEYGSD